MLPPSTIIASTLVLIFVLLVYPVLTTLLPSPRGPDWALKSVKTAVKWAFFVSLLPLFVFLNEGAEAIVTS